MDDAVYEVRATYMTREKFQSVPQPNEATEAPELARDPAPDAAALATNGVEKQIDGGLAIRWVHLRERRPLVSNTC